MTRTSRRPLLGLLCALALGACGTSQDPLASPTPAPIAGAPTPSDTGSPAATPPPPSAAPTGEPEVDGGSGETGTGTAVPPPAWLGTRVLEEGPEGHAPAQPTPPELTDRRLVTTDLLPPPADGTFTSTVEAVPDDVLERSTWVAECPVSVDDLRYVTVSFWGFDDRPHTGELLVHADAADDLVGVFAQLFEARFPIEEMRITRVDELDAPPTGDGNNTGAFVCRPTRGSSRWSEHAYGLAVDINPFHNPLVRGETILPELATAYADRTWERPGMIQPGGVVVEAFAAIGWTWGGDWSSLADYMHFSRSGR